MSWTLHTTRNKKLLGLLGAPGIATRSKDATRNKGPPGAMRRAPSGSKREGCETVRLTGGVHPLAREPKDHRLTH